MFIVHNEKLASFLTSLDSIIKAEDAVHVSGDKGIMSLAVRNANLIDLTTTERDYSPFAVDSKGRILQRGVLTDAEVLSDFYHRAVGGKTVLSKTYIPAYAADRAAMLAFDNTNGRALVQDDKIEDGQQSQSIQSTSTSFVAGTTIDLRAFQRVSIFPEVTTAAGTNADYKIQWSFDGTTWFDETVDTPTTVGTESVITQNTMIRRFDSSTTGVKSTAAVTLDKKARYVRIAQRSDAAVTVATTYYYQLLKV